MDELAELLKIMKMPDDLQQAQALYRRAAEITGDSSDAWLNLGVI